MIRKIFTVLVLGISIIMLSEAKAEVPLQPSRVYVYGTQLFVEKRLENGTLDNPKPYLIKGVSWSAATKAPKTGPNPLNPAETIPYGFFFDWSGRTPQGHEILIYWQRSQFLSYYLKDISLMKGMNANTVRVYLDFGDNPETYNKILDEFYNNGIMVIVTVATSKEDIESGRYLNTVNMYKDHPAILIWSLGNEWNFNMYYPQPGENFTIDEAIQLTNQAAQQIKLADPNHPVSSCLGDRFTDPDPKKEIGYIVRSCPDVNVWGLNVYRYPHFDNLFTQWQQISLSPFYISEFGTDSYSTSSYTIVNGYQADNCYGSVDQYKQANFIKGLWDEIMSHLSYVYPEQSCLGGLVHEFNDELWKAGSFHVGLGGLVDYNGADNIDNTADDDHSYDDYNTEGFYISEAHPDNVANEEYFGVVDANRYPKRAYTVLKDYYNSLNNFAPVLLPIGNKSVDEGSLLEFTILATDADGNTLTYSATGLPSGATFSPTTRTFSWTPTYNQAGSYKVTFYVSDGKGETDSETITITVINVNRAPLVGTINPSSGSSKPGQAVNFTTTYSDPDGWQDLYDNRFLINTIIDGRYCFLGRYDQNTNKLYLAKDNDLNESTRWLGGFAPGSSNTIENSYVRLNCASTTVSGSGNTLTIRWNVTFKSSFAGSKNMYLYVKDDTGAYNNWTQKGTWAITLPPVAKIEYTSFPIFSGLRITGYIYKFKGDKSYDPDGSIASYLWNSGDDRTSTLANPVWTYFCSFIPKAYTVTLTVKDDKGAIATAQTTILIPALVW